MFGQKQLQLNLETEIFTGFVGLGFSIAFIYLVRDLLFSPHFSLILIDSILVGSLAISYYLSKYKNACKVAVFPTALITMLSLTGFYFYRDGMRGSVPFFFIILAFCYPILLTSKPRKILLTVNFIIVLILAAIQVISPQYIEDAYYSHKDAFVSFGFILVMIFTVYGTLIIKKHYDKSNQLVLQKNAELNLKNEEIHHKNAQILLKAKEIEEINKKLNTLIGERTEKISRQNEVLFEYACFNSHKIRGPLARIMGLVELIKISHDELEKEMFFSKLIQSAEELDEAIGDVNKIFIEDEMKC